MARRQSSVETADRRKHTARLDSETSSELNGTTGSESDIVPWVDLEPGAGREGAAGLIVCDRLFWGLAQGEVVGFAFAVTPELLVQGAVYTALIGLVGGLFPAIRAARLPVATALREL